MSKRGQQSQAHEYDQSGACIYCGMYKVNVEAMSHECTHAREKEVDSMEVPGDGEQHQQ